MRVCCSCSRVSACAQFLGETSWKPGTSPASKVLQQRTKSNCEEKKRKESKSLFISIQPCFPSSKEGELLSWRFLLTAGGLFFCSRCHEACQRWLAFGSAAGVDWPGEFRKRERSGETWRRREEEKASPRAARPVQLHLYPSRDGELSGWSGPDERDQRGSAGLSTGGRRMVLSEAAASGDGHGKQHAVAAEGENDSIMRHWRHYVLYFLKPGSISVEV